MLGDNSDKVKVIFTPGEILQPGIISPIHTHSDGTNPHADVIYHRDDGSVGGKIKHLTPAEATYLNSIKGR